MPLPEVSPAQYARGPQTHCEGCGEPLYEEDTRRSFALCPDCDAKLDEADAQKWVAELDRAASDAWERRQWQ